MRAGDVVVVTGASRGIGAALCKRLAADGAKVGLLARDRGLLDQLVGAIGGNAHAVTVDVTDSDALRVALDEVATRLGPIEVLINNAGHGHWDAVIDSDEGAFRSAIEVNYLATVVGTLHVLPGMLRRGSGHIVNIGSIAGRIGSPFEAAYSASKFAVSGFSEALAGEIEGTGVSVSMIHPGPVETGFAASRRRAAPNGAPAAVPVEDVVAAVVATLRRPRRNRYVPPWLGLAVTARWIAPVASRIGVARLFRTERRALRNRFGHHD